MFRVLNFRFKFFKYIHKILDKFGVRLIESSIFYKSQDIVRLIQKNGYPVKNIFDVGAHKGEWSLNLARYLKNDVKFYLFEPSPFLREHLEKLCLEQNWNLFSEVLGAENKKAIFYSKGSTGDSLFPEFGTDYEDSHKFLIEVRTLTELVKTNNLPIPELIKLDCQGGELDILLGFKEYLHLIPALIIETHLIDTNQNSPNILQVISKLSEFLFYPYSIVEVHNRSGVLNQLDILFLNKRFEKLNKYTKIKV